MNNNNLLVYGAVAVGAIFLYSRYAKKPTTPQEEPQGGCGGGGGGGGGFAPIGPIGPLPIIPNVVIQNIPRPVNQGRSYNAEDVTKSRDTTPTAAVTSSAQAKAIETATNTGGIVPISQGGSTTPRQTGSVVQISQADLNKGISGGMVFKPFDGDNGRLRLENLVRSFNRP
jgi:hypothetical protein